MTGYRLGCPGCGRLRNINPEEQYKRYCLSCVSIRDWMDLPAPGPWIADARCAETDPDIFFPGKWDHAQRNAAKKICGECEVRLQCLEYALLIQAPHGIWGGLTADERRTIRKEPA